MAIALSFQFECRSIWLVVENSSEWRSLDSEIPSFKLQEKISRGRFEKLSKNCQNFWSAKLLSSQVFVVSLYNKDRDWHFWSTRMIFGQKVEYAGFQHISEAGSSRLFFVCGKPHKSFFLIHIYRRDKIYFTRILGVN